jgi:hypothetical protein
MQPEYYSADIHTLVACNNETAGCNIAVVDKFSVPTKPVDKTYH